MNDTYKTEITAEHRLLDLHLKETFIDYWDLITLFVKRNFVANYKQTILGPAWAIVQPLLTTFVYTIIFGNLAKLTKADIPGDFVLPGFLFYLSGSILWGLFSSTLSATSGTFLRNAGIMGKVYYPRLVAPVSTAISHLISFAIQFAMLLLVWLFYVIRGGTSIQPGFQLLLLPLIVLETMVLATGFGIIISSVTTKYRDMIMLVGFGLQLWQYASPVAYGLELIPVGWRWLYMCNPMTTIITSFRYSLFGFGYFNLTSFLVGWVVSLVVFFIGLVMFSRIERTFMDTI